MAVLQRLVVPLLIAVAFFPSAKGSNQKNAPLYLTPYITGNDLEAGRKAARVVDPCNISDVTEDCGAKIPDSYAGFLTVDENLGNHYFFWYFPSPNKSAPLLIWLNGGPGVSSMTGLLLHNGPMRPRTADKNGANSKGKFEERPGSWLDLFSLLYIDNPVMTGYSHSSTGPHMVPEQYGHDLYTCVTQFYQLFPHLLSKDLYVGGMSYAGKYVSILAYKLHVARTANRTTIPLKGIYLFAPLFSPRAQFPRFSDAYYKFGIVSKKQGVDLRRKVKQLLKESREEKDAGKQRDALNNLIYTLYEIGMDLPTGLDNYVTGERVDFEAVRAIMDSNRVRSAIHAGNASFEAFNSHLIETNLPEVLFDTSKELASLLNSGRYKVLIASGDYDILVSTSMVEHALSCMRCWRGRQSYVEAKRQKWQGLTVNGVRQLFGHYTSVNKLCRVVVHGAGHDICSDQLGICTDMMTQFVRDGCVKSSI
ncbi:carboxypeptidase [Elysia marginata]|uniref:Carboxypeptidase n=1 Tax=Elysia marginata TaxID=1093978 RepID=A0AAV4IL46_9GAST|nr:carboxypeptidase [Elysia marginata]